MAWRAFGVVRTRFGVWSGGVEGCHFGGSTQIGRAGVEARKQIFGIGES